MDKQTLIDLYVKERKYQETVFGDYKNDPDLSLASFLLFIEEYVLKAKRKFVQKWDKDLPIWMSGCKESTGGKAAPVGAYEDLIKVFALTGAALEAYLDVEPERWREDGINPKWLEQEEAQDG